MKASRNKNESAWNWVGMIMNLHKKKRNKHRNSGCASHVCIVLIVMSVVFLSILLNSQSVAGELIAEDSLAKTGFVYVEPDNITRESALNALLKAEDDIKEMTDDNLSVIYPMDILLKAKRAYIGEDTSYLKDDIKRAEDLSKRDYLESLLKVAYNTPSYEIERLNYSQVFMTAQLIAYRKEQAFRILDTIPLLEEKETEYRKEKINTSEAVNLLEKAKKSFEEERYDEAEKQLVESDLRLEEAISEYRRIKELFRLGTNFFVRYWLEIIFLIAVLAVIIRIAVKKIRVWRARNRLAFLRMEIQTLNRLLIKAQEDYLKNKTITKETYSTLESRYKDRITEIKHKIPVLESIVSEKHEKSEKTKRKGILEVR